MNNKSDANISAGANINQANFSQNNVTRGRASGHGINNGRVAGNSQHGETNKSRKRKSSEKVSHLILA